jgi:alkyl hydroperoxide reductase subunit F
MSPCWSSIPAARRCGAAEEAAQPAQRDRAHQRADHRSAGRRQKVTGLVYKDRVGGDAHRVELEGIFVQIGLLPNTEWLKDTVALSPRGEIVIDDRGQTNLPGVFAAGDCTTVPYKQIIIAMGAGSTAALSAFDHLIRSSVSNSSGAVAEAA